MSSRRLTLAILFSGGGRTMMNLHRQIVDGQLPAEILVAVSSRADAAGVTRAKEAGIATVVADRKSLDEDTFCQRIGEAVRGADLVCMAGFLSLWPVPKALYGRVINIHPALLPAFGGPGMYGLRVHRAVLAAGHTVSGCTVHVCDNQYDHGPIILQRTVPVLPGDTPEALAERVFAEECVAYPEAVRLYCEDRVRIVGQRVVIC